MFIGRRAYLADLETLWRKRAASIVACRDGSGGKAPPPAGAPRRQQAAGAGLFRRVGEERRGGRFFRCPRAGGEIAGLARSFRNVLSDREGRAGIFVWSAGGSASAKGFRACAREAILQSCRLPCGGWAGVPCPVPPVTGRHKVCTCKSDNSRKSGQFSFQMLVAGCAHAHLSAAFWNGPDQSLRGKQRRGFSRPGQASLPPRGPERKHGR